MVASQALTIRLPENVHEALRNAAFVRRQSMTAIVAEALRAHIPTFIVDPPEGSKNADH